MRINRVMPIDMPPTASPCSCQRVVWWRISACKAWSHRSCMPCHGGSHIHNDDDIHDHRVQFSGTNAFPPRYPSYIIIHYLMTSTQAIYAIVERSGEIRISLPVKEIPISQNKGHLFFCDGFLFWVGEVPRSQRSQIQKEERVKIMSIMISMPISINLRLLCARLHHLPLIRIQNPLRSVWRWWLRP